MHHFRKNPKSKGLVYHFHTYLKGILHQKIFYRLNLIFWIVMGCGIARFGRRGLKTTETWKFWSQNLSPGVLRRGAPGVSRHSTMGFRGAATLIKHFSDLSFRAVPRGPVWLPGYCACVGQTEECCLPKIVLIDFGSLLYTCLDRCGIRNIIFSSSYCSSPSLPPWFTLVITVGPTGEGETGTMDNAFAYFAPTKTVSKTDTSNEKYKVVSEYLDILHHR